MTRLARIIALVNQKGGPGKTTLTMHLAGALARRGEKVLIVDADPQATATRWAASAPDETPFPAAVAGLGSIEQRLHREIRKFIGDYDYLIIDCPPSADSPISQSALLVADLALVPVIPSPPDLWAGVAIRQTLQSVEAVNEDLKARVVINQRKRGTRLAGKTLELLPKYGIPILKTQIGDREAFRHAAAAGLTAGDLGPRAAQAAADIDALTDEVLGLLNRDSHE